MADSLADKLARQTALVNELRLQQPNNTAELDEARKVLGELKKALNSGSKDKEKGSDAKKGDKVLLKTAKGTRDFGPSEMLCRLHIESILKEVFTTYGGCCLDTPVFERKDVLTGKYGEDSKLIFDLKDQGGEELALRYDHTVPLARYLAMSGGTNTQFKLWQVGKVYRRDQPVMSKGRMREFVQADFDISGSWDPMIPDSEVISLICTILSRLDVGEFTVKINHRKILDGIFEVCGVPADKIRTISSAVDKLDKMPWLDVKKEMTDEKGLDPAVADKIGEYVKLKGGPSLLDTLKANSTLMANKKAAEGIADMELLFKYLQAYNVVERMSFDLSLARGLDYYTGIIYEAIVEGSAPPGFTPNPNPSDPQASAPPPPPPKKKEKKKKEGDDEEEVDESQVGVGSIAAGGRYDGLVGMFASSSSSKDKKAADLPCIGVSFGVERIYSLIYPKWLERGMRRSGKETMVYILAAGDGLLEERIKLTSYLRANGVKADFLPKLKPKIPQQFAAGERDEVPFAVILGETEIKQGLVTVKEQTWEMKEGKREKITNDDKGVQVRRDELIEWLKGREGYREWAG